MIFQRSLSHLRGSNLARALLLSMGFFDELTAGFPMVALPLLRERLHLDYAQVGFLFTAATLSGMVIDPFVNILSDRAAKKPWILGGLVLLVLSSALLGVLTSYPLLLLTFMVWYPANGAGVGLAQAVVIDGAPDEAARTMTRWTLLSSVGDFLSPLVVAAFVSLGLGWSALNWLAAALWLGIALMFLPLRFPARSALAETDADEEQISVWTHLREAIRDPQLLRWSALTLIPTMLDEIFLGFVALYLSDVWHLGEAEIALSIIVQMLASFLGLFLLDRVLKRRKVAPVRTLFWLSFVSLLGIIGLLTVHVLWFILVMLPLISFCCAGWYPLAHAEAYARRPASSGTVRVVIGLGAPLEMLLPGAVGLVAGSFGILAGLGILGLAPVLMLALLPYRRKG